LAACALLGGAALLSAIAATASSGTPGPGSTALQAALRHDLRHYLTTRRKAGHISAVSLRVTFPGAEPAINLAVGTTLQRWPRASPRYLGRAATAPAPEPAPFRLAESSRVESSITIELAATDGG
jgi:hypothetical protein